jgi:hypothetical protein
MDTTDNIELHDLASIEEKLSTDVDAEGEGEAEGADAFMISSASGFMISSASGFMIS